MLPRTPRRGEQFHSEVTAQGPERWFIGHAFEIATNADLSVENLRAESARWAPGLDIAAAKRLRRVSVARRLIEDWLAEG